MSERNKILLCLAWGLPWTLAGLLLCATIVFAPVGLLLLVVGALPLYRQQKSSLRRKQEWQDRDHPMPTDAIKPWLIVNNEPASNWNERVEPDA